MGISQSTRPGPPTHFSKETEEEMKVAIEALSEMGHGAGCDEMQILAEERTSKSEDPEPFKNGLPIRGWVGRFKKKTQPRRENP